MKRKWRAALALAVMAAALTGCMKNGAFEDIRWTAREDLPAVPEKLDVNGDGVPVLTVYDVDDADTAQMDVEQYVAGVVAGEMKNDWPEEALKAQAILARTFVLKFCQDKKSKYEGADISTDVSEAQAYAPRDINERVSQAVRQTRGQVMSVAGSYPNAWFHAHSGGMTELPSVALDYRGEDPEYLKPVKSAEAAKAPEDVRRWEAVFAKDEVERACAEAGVKVSGVETVELGEKGASGRAATLLVNGASVSAPTFRIRIGANRLKSTLIDSVELQGDSVVFKGRGFGHGVGMAQWGAYGMARRGSDAEQIIRHYFPGVEIVRLWK